MSILIVLLWLLGLAFLVVLWMAVAASLFEMVRGVLGRPRGAAVPIPVSSGGAHPTWSRGLVAGALGYAVVVVLYAALNLLGGKSVFLTPALLGQSLLGRPVGEAIGAGPVLVYNGLHLVVFLAFGLIAAWLLLESERHPKIWYLAFVLLLVLFLHAIGFVLWLAAPAGSAIPPWSIVIASAGAGIAMATYLLRSRPQTLTTLQTADLEA